MINGTIGAMRSFRLERKKKKPDSEPGENPPSDAAPAAGEDDREPTPLEAAAAHLEASEQSADVEAASGEPTMPAEPDGVFAC